MDPHQDSHTRHGGHRFPDDGGERPGVRLGNDVVDLAHPSCRSRPRDDRLPARILTPDERAWMEEGEGAADRLLRLWCLWAGKEAAFKVISKLRGRPPVFRHREFDVAFGGPPSATPSGRLEGRVRWQTTTVGLEGVVTGAFIHVVGWGGGTDPEARPRLEVGVERWRSSSPGEGADMGPGERRRAASRAAREVARARLASHLKLKRDDDHTGPGAVRVEISSEPGPAGRTPPVLIVNGHRRHDMDLSLSHHGRYVGWAILLAAAGPGGDAALRPPDGG